MQPMTNLFRLVVNQLLSPTSKAPFPSTLPPLPRLHCITPICCPNKVFLKAYLHYPTECNSSRASWEPDPRPWPCESHACFRFNPPSPNPHPSLMPGHSPATSHQRLEQGCPPLLQQKGIPQNCTISAIQCVLQIWTTVWRGVHGAHANILPGICAVSITFSSSQDRVSVM